jgi:Putative prokaryotic signal transducing protein
MALVRLTVVANEVDAELVCGLLRSNGIACDFRSTDTAAGARDGAAGPVGPREIVVDEADLDAARELLPG